MTFEEKKEQIVETYSQIFDKDTAYRIARVTNKEREYLENDQDFQDRMEYFLIEERAMIMENLKTFMKSTDDKIAYKATQDYMNLIYPDFLAKIDKPKDINLNVNPGKNSEEEDQRIANEYGELLQDPGKFVKRLSSGEEANV